MIDVSFPSSLPRPEESIRVPRRSKPLAGPTCPACGHRASREVLTVHRPGEPSVRRTVLRCLRAASGKTDPLGRTKGHRCPLSTESEAPLPSPLAAAQEAIAPDPEPVEPEEEAEVESKPCAECGAPVGPCPKGTRRFCRTCAQRRAREGSRRRSREHAERVRATRQAEGEPTPAAPVPMPAEARESPVPGPVTERDLHAGPPVRPADLLRQVLSLPRDVRAALLVLLAAEEAA